MTQQEPFDKNLFMICRELEPLAQHQTMPKEFTLRNLRPSELNAWKAMPFDNEAAAKKFRPYMDEYFDLVFKDREEEFYQQCLVAIDKATRKIIATCFAWKAYDGTVTTIQWMKVKKEYEKTGVGRAILSAAMKNLTKKEYPVYLHTQPSNMKTIQLYTDFGYKLIQRKKIGQRKNHLSEYLTALKIIVPNLKLGRASKPFLEAIKTSDINQF